ncbi:MAG: ribonuclease E activity regulator RraA [Gammaproteobacteria bacterium]|nr:ribonuclease E activity regulator RraA [Gammaproteobacteria bacterium]
MRPTTDLYDDFEDACQTCSLQFRNFGGRAGFFGRIRTVRCFHDNVLFRQLLSEPGDGGVIVVDGGGSTAMALMGDMLAARAQDNGWAGVIINGAIRDSAEIAGIDIGVKALGVNPAKSKKKGEGELDVVLEFGGAQFRPGDWVYCDEDGVLISAVEIE